MCSHVLPKTKGFENTAKCLKIFLDTCACAHTHDRGCLW